MAPEGARKLAGVRVELVGSEASAASWYAVSTPGSRQAALSGVGMLSSQEGTRLAAVLRR